MFAASKTGRAVGGGPGPGPTPTDPSFAYVPLLLNTTSTDGQQNNTFLDSGTANGGVGFTITRNGTPTQGSITPYWPNGQWSNFFNGSTDWLSSTNATTVLQFGSSAYTIEGWVYQTSRSGTPFICGGVFSGTGLQVAIDASGFIYVSIPGVANLAAATIAIPLNTWTHFAIVRSSTSAGGFTYYINGVAAGTPTDSNNYSGTATTFNIATTNNSSIYVLTGYLSNFRIVKGVAVYTGAFTPPAAPLAATQSAGTNIAAITGTQTAILTCQSNRFLDRSAQVTPATITPNGTPRVQAFQPFSPTASYTTALYGGSGYFNGSTDYVSAPSNAAFTLGTGDFTVEAWIYPTSSTGVRGVMGLADGGSTGSFVFFYNLVANKVTFNNTNGSQATSVASIVLNCWTHVAFSRASGSLKIFINGALDNTVSFADDGTKNVCAVGRSYTTLNQEYFPGYIANLRIVKGTAVYTAAFTPPTSPVTNVTNTSLLLNMTNAGIYDAAVQNNFTSFQNAVVSLTPTPTVGTASLKVLTVGDYLTTPANPAFLLGTGDFTIEAWIYPTSTTNFISVMGIGTNGTTGDLQWFYNFNGNTNKVTLNCTGGTTVTSTASVPTSQWTYVAFSRASGSLKLFIGGALDKTVSFADNLTKNELVVGRSYASLNQEYFRGYVQDLRITKGVGRYNALTSIPVPTAPFPTR